MLVISHNQRVPGNTRHIQQLPGFQCCWWWKQHPRCAGGDPEIETQRELLFESKTCLEPLTVNKGWRRMNECYFFWSIDTGPFFPGMADLEDIRLSLGWYWWFPDCNSHPQAICGDHRHQVKGLVCAGNDIRLWVFHFPWTDSQTYESTWNNHAFFSQLTSWPRKKHHVRWFSHWTEVPPSHSLCPGKKYVEPILGKRFHTWRAPKKKTCWGMMPFYYPRHHRTKTFHLVHAKHSI